MDVYFDRNTHQFVGLDGLTKLNLKEAYKGIDIDAELARMCVWLISPKGKGRKGSMAFILNWLNNASISRAVPSVEIEHPLTSLLQQYRISIWTNCEHLLEINTITRKS